MKRWLIFLYVVKFKESKKDTVLRVFNELTPEDKNYISNLMEKYKQ